MRFFKRRGNEGGAVTSSPVPSTTQMTVTLVEGDCDLDVVGESYRQQNLWNIVGGHTDQYIKQPIVAVLVPENNPHDPNAIAVYINGLMVGYLPREIAAKYRPGLNRLMKEHQHPIALAGQVIGGGRRDDGIGNLGVFLKHDPADFVESPEASLHESHIRTGAHDIAAHNGLRWRDDIPDDDIQAIPYLRRLLRREQKPIERHFIYGELERRLYHSRGAFNSALIEYDEVSRQHDAEMDTVLPALKASFGGIPLLATYRQACIRHQHAKSWEEALWWVERGLTLYGEDALDPEFPSDLNARRERCTAEIERQHRAHTSHRTARAEPSSSIETLTCISCGTKFERPRTRGRKPSECSNCRNTTHREGRER